MAGMKGLARVQRLAASQARSLAAAPYSYAEVGATQDAVLPEGWHSSDRRIQVGRGLRAFEEYADDLLSWRLHRRAGLLMRVSADRVEPNAVSVAGFGIGPLRIKAPCRVVYLVIEERRVAFAYGTLPGHPLAGEERFEVGWDADDVVRFDVRLFSRPASMAARLGGPITIGLQSLINRRYLRAARDR
jgi:uncharacterized protein (UPF0548 family)